MDEILQKLLSAEVLSEETKAEISTQLNEFKEQFEKTVREEVTLEVRSELAEQWATERDALVEKVDQFVNDKLVEEISELKADIESFRDLEAEYAGKIVEEKHSMAEQLSEELDELVDKMDAFFELRLSEELNELKEDLEVVKQNEFGRKIFEAFATEFGSAHIDEDSTQSKLAVAVEKLDDANAKIEKLEESQSVMVRGAKLEKLLSSLNGKKREQMEFVLQNVETTRLEEAYKHFIGRVLKEETQEIAPKAAKQALTESANVVITGEESAPAAPAKQDFSELRMLAGI